ncbi:MAG: hypothetical protein KGP01_05465 [Actinomycetales bacterium]|nr:hypothetical protein [Actinomycetales bacterium]
MQPVSHTHLGDCAVVVTAEEAWLMPLDERHEPVMVALPFGSGERDHVVRSRHQRAHRPYQYLQVFFAAVADRLVDVSDIVLIGHGRGKGNAAHGLRDHLLQYAPDIAARIRCDLDVDLSARTPRQLLLIARDALDRERHLHAEAG